VVVRLRVSYEEEDTCVQTGWANVVVRLRVSYEEEDTCVQTGWANVVVRLPFLTDTKLISIMTHLRSDVAVVHMWHMRRRIHVCRQLISVVVW
jgi:hypothetical protein